VDIASSSVDIASSSVASTSSSVGSTSSSVDIAPSSSAGVARSSVGVACSICGTINSTSTTKLLLVLLALLLQAVPCWQLQQHTCRACTLDSMDPRRISIGTKSATSSIWFGLHCTTEQQNGISVPI
jgi:hypothetical protein